MATSGSGSPTRAAVKRSFCRCCLNKCAIKVTVEAGRALQVIGDIEDPLYGGYTCVKGRSQPNYLSDPDRLLQSLKRVGDDFVPIPIDDAMDEIAEKLVAIREQHGPRAIAGYRGTMMVATNGADEIYRELMKLLGTHMEFDTITIDKGGKQVAAALFGKWLAPAQGFDSPDVMVLIGANPLLTYTGFPAGNPNRWLKENLARGMKLIVIDPRRTEVAAQAHLHLQAAPGHDPGILASLAHVILREGLFDCDFVAQNVDGLGSLRSAIQAFAPDVVGARAGVRAEDILVAARIFGCARRGFVWCGTGPSMAATGTLTEYLALVLDTLCGHWLRGGEVVRNAPTLLPERTYRAQASSPVAWSHGERMRVRSLTRTVAGVPTAALADEILLEGEGQIRALLSWNGNPALAVPDHGKIVSALQSLELLVQVDNQMSATAQLADYVIAPRMPLEVASSTILLDYSTSMPAGYGIADSYANYTPAIVPVPPESDLIEEWLFFKGLHSRMAHEMKARGEQVPSSPPVLNARHTDELLEILSEGSRVPFRVVRDRGRGAFYVDEGIRVAEREMGWRGKFDVANSEILAALDSLASTGTLTWASDAAYPFRLICRRVNHVYNSSYNLPSTNRGRPFNSAYVHPDDLTDLGLTPGDLVDISSDRGVVVAVVDADRNLRRGLVSMAYAFGGGPDTDHLVRSIGTSPNRLIADDQVFDPYLGQPRMSNVPVRISPHRDVP